MSGVDRDGYNDRITGWIISPNKGFTIRALPFHLKGDKWSTYLVIRVERYEKIAHRQFSAPETFRTREEAVTHCLQFGMDIIDGRVEGCTVEGL